MTKKKNVLEKLQVRMDYDMITAKYIFLTQSRKKNHIKMCPLRDRWQNTRANLRIVQNSFICIFLTRNNNLPQQGAEIIKQKCGPS